MGLEQTAVGRRTERGVALVMVILILLVLTALGITATMLMTQEDRISARQEQQKAAFYAAEAGLRRGERVLITIPDNSFSKLTDFLVHAPRAKTVAAPDPIPVQPPDWSIRHLGTYLTDLGAGGNELANQEVTQLSGTVTMDRVRAYYSLYVRNNPEDPGGPTTNTDALLRLVSVGFLTDANGVDANGNANVLAVKILEEEYNFWGGGTSPSAQKELNAGATSSGVWQGGS